MLDALTVAQKTRKLDADIFEVGMWTVVVLFEGFNKYRGGCVVQ